MSGNSRFAVTLHILAYLAYRKGAAVPSAEIAASVDTNPVVIRRLLAALVTAKLVTAHKGATGGFVLSANPRAISLLEVYRAVEPSPMLGLRRFAPNHKCPVGARIEEILQQVFANAQDAMERELSSVTLADVEKQLHPVCPGRH